ncbi:MAG: xylulose kinase [Mesorhizobium sp.]|uniref:xylulokinase n=1 Tax=Mesorhizobium sp. TaxID=1871066 RepID=UPI001226F588|nr:FGGY-family carbohydrate kinase [Mesorhizobium sp.]TIP25997.1 MAG: xylulose kinase [Mesorhizobium sp.]
MGSSGGPLVVGLDSSTQSCKAIAWSREGRAVAEGRAPLELMKPRPDYVEQEVTDWWRAATVALRQLVGAVDAKRIVGIAISNQRETVALIDGAGEPIGPASLWLDERAAGLVDRFAAEIGRERLHAITGKPIDVTPVVYRLKWLRENEQERLDQANKILDVHGYLTLRLTGTPSASWTSADPFGLFDISRKEWSQPILDHLGIKPSQFPNAVRSGTRVGTVHAAAASATGLAEGTPVIAAGGDGQCAGLGVNAMRDGVVYLNLGTAIVAGIWSREPVVGAFWRTMTSPTGDGYFLEAVQRAGVYFVNWFVDMFAGGRSDPAIFDRLEREAATVPIGSDGLLAGTTLVGCMDPHWDPSARASFIGMHPSHTLGHFYRAGLEAMTLQTARALEEMRSHGLSPAQMVAIGGGANSRLWTKMIADATGIAIHKGHNAEASSLGAAISAAVGVGWFESFSDAADAMTSIAETIEPDPSCRAAWDALSARQAKVFSATQFAWRTGA